MAEESLKSQTKKGLYWKFAEQFSNYGIQFIVGIAMARMLSPEIYGITAIPAIFIAVAGIFANGGFNSAMVRKPDLTEEDLATAFYYSTGVGIITYIILFFGAPWLADFYNAPVLCPLLRVTGLGFIYGPLGTPQGIILQRRLDFKTPTKIAVVTRILAGVIGVSMAYCGYGVWALTLSAMFSGIVGLVLTWYVVRWVPKAGWSNASFKYLWGFGNKIMASSLLNTVYDNISPAFIGKYYSPADLGCYNRAQNYASLPSSNVYGVISNVTLPVLSKMQDDDERLSLNYRRMLRVACFIVFPLMMGLAALARPLVITMITAKWEGCIVLLQIMCFSMMWYPFHALNLNLLFVKGRSDYFLNLEIVKKIYCFAIMAIALPMGIIQFCISGLISTAISLYVNTYYTGKLLDLGFIRQMRDLMPIFLLSLLMFSACFGLTFVIPNYVAQIFAGTITGMVIYLGLAYLLKFPELEDVKYLLSRK